MTAQYLMPSTILAINNAYHHCAPYSKTRRAAPGLTIYWTEAVIALTPVDADPQRHTYHPAPTPTSPELE